MTQSGKEWPWSAYNRNGPGWGIACDDQSRQAHPLPRANRRSCTFPGIYESLGNVSRGAAWSWLVSDAVLGWFPIAGRIALSSSLAMEGLYIFIRTQIFDGKSADIVWLVVLRIFYFP